MDNTIIGTLAVISSGDSSDIGPTTYSTNTGKVSFKIIPSQPINQENKLTTNETQ
jgi:hypothetical protein